MITIYVADGIHENRISQNSWTGQLHVVGQHFLETYKLTGNRFSIHIEIHLANFFEFCFLFDHLVVRFVTVVSLESCFQDIAS